VADCDAEEFVEKVQRRANEPFNFRHGQFKQLGLHSTVTEPRRVYCDRCGAEIDPWKILSDPPQTWWRCPRGCNQTLH
jgi:hypothetical protein